MQKTVDGRDNQPKTLRWLPELDRLLIVGIRGGPAAKRDAINRIVGLVPAFTRGDCWKRIRYLRKTPQIAAVQKCQPGRSAKSKIGGHVRRSTGTPWTTADDDRLLDLAGYERVESTRLLSA